MIAWFASLGWAQAMIVLFSVFVGLIGASILTSALWRMWRLHRRKKGLRCLYRDIYRHRITPKFDMKDYK